MKGQTENPSLKTQALSPFKKSNLIKSKESAFAPIPLKRQRATALLKPCVSVIGRTKRGVDASEAKAFGFDSSCLTHKK